MKNIISFIQAALLLISTSLYAQKEIKVTRVNREMSRGMQTGFMVNIPEANLKEVRAAYEKQLEENTKSNAKEMNDELINYGAVNKNLSLQPFIVYAKLMETIEGVELTAFVSEDSINFINESSVPEKVAALEKSLHDFAVNEYKKVVTKQLGVENDKLKELNKALENQISNEKSNTKEIGSKQREIESYKSRIEDNKAEQSVKSKQIAEQKKMVEGFTNKESPEYNLSVKNLKKYEGEKKDLEKGNEKLNRSIENNNADIKDLERENEDLKKQQEESKQKIDTQSGVVKEVEAKLNGIK